VIVKGIASEELVALYSKAEVMSFQAKNFISGLLDCLVLVPNRGACIAVCLSVDVTRSFRFHDIKPFASYAFHNHSCQSLQKCQSVSHVVCGAICYAETKSTHGDLYSIHLWSS